MPATKPLRPGEAERTQGTMSSLEPSPSTQLGFPLPGAGSSPALRPAVRRSLTRLGEQTLLRVGQVHADGLIVAELCREIDRLTQVAMSGHTMLCKWRDVQAGSDPLLADELRFFTDVSRLGKGELIANTIASFQRRGCS